MEIMLNTNSLKHKSLNTEIMHKSVDLKRIKLQKKVLLKLHHQQTIKVALVAKDGKMDSNFHHSIINMMSHIKWENL